jgi:hypothetical protein
MLLWKSGKEELNIAGLSSMGGPEAGESKYVSKLQSNKKKLVTCVCSYGTKCGERKEKGD